MPIAVRARCTLDSSPALRSFTEEPGSAARSRVDILITICNVAEEILLGAGLYQSPLLIFR